MFTKRFTRCLHDADTHIELSIIRFKINSAVYPKSMKKVIPKAFALHI